jgi:hypothetical protein
MKLGELTRVWQCNDDDPPDEDTTIIARIGSLEAIGKVVEDRDRPLITHLNNHICIKPLDKNKLLPKYLYYAMQHVHMQGHWKRVGHPGTANRYQIKVKDVKDVDVQEI